MTPMTKRKVRTVKRHSDNLGGKRDGAGRRPIFATPMRSCSLQLRPDDFVFLKERALGGSLSEGLRRIIDEARHKGD